MVAISGTGWKLAPSLIAYVREADRYYPQRDRSADGSIGDLAHQARVSDHNPAADGLVHAVDLDEDIAPGLDLKAFAERIRRRRDHRIKYVIYEGRMFSSYATAARAAWEWGPYSGANAHLHHLHLSILNSGPAETDLSSWGFAPAATPAPTPPEAPDVTPEQDARLKRIDARLSALVPDTPRKVNVATGELSADGVPAALVWRWLRQLVTADHVDAAAIAAAIPADLAQQVADELAKRLAT